MLPASVVIQNQVATIRPVIPDDASAWLKYLCQVGDETDYLAFSSADVSMTIQQAYNYLDYISQRKNDLFLVTAMENRIIASLHFQGARWPRSRHRGQLGISVLEEYWNHGIASSMINCLLDWGRANGITKIDLKVRTDNHRAIQLYSRLGFVVEGTISRECFRQGVYYSAFHMGLKL